MPEDPTSAADGHATHSSDGITRDSADSTRANPSTAQTNGGISPADTDVTRASSDSTRADSDIARANSDIDPDDGRNETEAERSDRNWNDILQELRVTQTGTQIISGFLLTVAFQQRFPRLPGYELAIYGVLVALAAASTLLGLSIVSIHRARFHRHEKARVVTVASRLLFITIWVVAILTAGVVLFIFDFVFGLTAGVIAAIVALAVILGFLLLLPWGTSRRGETSSNPTSR